VASRYSSSDFPTRPTKRFDMVRGSGCLRADLTGFGPAFGVGVGVDVGVVDADDDADDDVDVDIDVVVGGGGGVNAKVGGVGVVGDLFVLVAIGIGGGDIATADE
jgi:hypothetical protein